MRETLLFQIEECRKEMIDLSSSNELTSDIVVNTSKNLDILLNNLNEVTYNTKNENK